MLKLEHISEPTPEASDEQWARKTSHKGVKKDIQAKKGTIVFHIDAKKSWDLKQRCDVTCRGEENTKNFSKMRSIRLYRNKKGKAVEDAKKGKTEKNRGRETEKGKTVEHCKGDYKNGK